MNEVLETLYNEELGFHNEGATEYNKEREKALDEIMILLSEEDSEKIYELLSNIAALDQKYFFERGFRIGMEAMK